MGTMKVGLVGFLVLGLLVVDGVRPALAQACGPYKEPHIVAMPLFMNPVFDHSLRTDELRALKNGGGTIKPMARRSDGMVTTVSGLTSISAQTATSAQTQYLVYSDGTVCAQVVEVDLTLQTDEMTVYIASEIPRGTCTYKAVVEHELKHVEIARNYLNHVLPVAEAHIREFLRRVGVVRTTADRKEETTRQINKAIEAYMAPLNENIITALKNMEDELDTREEYSRLQELCPGEMSEFMRRSAISARP